MKRPRALFFGTPEIAIPALEVLASMCEVVRVITQPDQPAGRGQRIQPPPVKRRALEMGLSVEQPLRLKPPEVAASWRALEVDVAVVVAYGRILPPSVLQVPRKGCLNIHASILPRWRGAAPAQWAILAGDKETGVCLMEMDEGLDTGPVVSSVRTSIGENESAGELLERLAHLGAELLARDLIPWLEGSIVPRPQEGEPTHAPPIERKDAVLDFSYDALSVHNRIRAMNPWPIAETRISGERLKVHRSVVLSHEGEWGGPGTLLAINKEGLDVACAKGVLRLLETQLEGRKRLPAYAMAQGMRLRAGERFGD
ncbi:MAG: methionyl-tRNA formyltransferase [Sandaracinaceae bacterium]|nr:methionyl-tRNA formyltransferase [Sandaracinaceae bacterium]